MKMPQRSKAGQRGNAAIEFALSFACIWGIFTGVFEFGHSMYIYNNLATSVTDGARYAARVDFDDPAHTFITKVKNVVLYGSPTAGASTIVPGLTAANINVTWTTDSAGLPVTITVAVTGYTVNAIFGNFTFTNKPSVTMKYMGSYKS